MQAVPQPSNSEARLTSIFCEQKPGVDFAPLTNLLAQSAILSMAAQQSMFGLCLSSLAERCMVTAD